MEQYLGTWQVAPSDGFWTNQSISDSEAMLSSAVKHGITCFDTARSYGKGQAEQTLGKILRRHSGTRFTIDTKIMPSSKEPSELLKPALAALGHVDCLYLHWPKSGFDNSSYLKAMARLKEDGTISKLGVCNVPLDYLKTLVSEGLPIDRIQRPLSPLWSREYEETAKFCREKGIEVAVYSPSGMGLLSGRYLQAGDLNDARATLFCFDPRCIGPYHELLDLVLEIASGKLTTGTQVALSWTKAKNPDIVILGARNERQLRENLSNDVPLTEQELSDLDNAARNLDMASNEVCANMFSYDW